MDRPGVRSRCVASLPAKSESGASEARCAEVNQPAKTTLQVIPPAETTRNALEIPLMGSGIEYSPTVNCILQNSSASGIPGNVLVNTLVYRSISGSISLTILCSHKWLRIGKISTYQTQKSDPSSRTGRRMPQQRSDESLENRADWYRLLVRQLFCLGEKLDPLLIDRT